MIHFSLTSSKNYRAVQEQILGLIKRHLPDGSWTESYEYEAGKLNFSLFIHQKSDVLMSHGAADKNYHFRKDEHDPSQRLNHTMGRKYLIVPGAWLKRRIVSSRALSFSDSQVQALGWPRLDLLISQLQAQGPGLPSGRRKKILWAPTHDFARRGKDNVSLSSFPDFEEFIPALAERYDVSISLHPRNRKNKTPTQGSLLEADVVITDFGTMVYEAVALGKQVIFPSWIVGDPIRRFLRASAEREIFDKRHGLHADSFDHLIDMIESNAQMDAASKAFFDDFLPPETYGCSAKLVADFLLLKSQF